MTVTLHRQTAVPRGELGEEERRRDARLAAVVPPAKVR